MEEAQIKQHERNSSMPDKDINMNVRQDLEEKSGIRRRSIIPAMFQVEKPLDEGEVHRGERYKSRWGKLSLKRILERKESFTDRNDATFNRKSSADSSLLKSASGSSPISNDYVMAAEGYVRSDDCVEALPNDRSNNSELFVVTRSFEYNPEARRRWSLLKSSIALLGLRKAKNLDEINDSDSTKKRNVGYDTVKYQIDELQEATKEEAHVGTQEIVRACERESASKEGTKSLKTIDKIYKEDPKRGFTSLQQSESERYQSINGGSGYEAGRQKPSASINQSNERVVTETLETFKNDVFGKENFSPVLLDASSQTEDSHFNVSISKQECQNCRQGIGTGIDMDNAYYTEQQYFEPKEKSSIRPVTVMVKRGHLNGLLHARIIKLQETRPSEEFGFSERDCKESYDDAFYLT
eukprot:gene6034-11408_t